MHFCLSVLQSHGTKESPAERDLTKHSPAKWAPLQFSSDEEEEPNVAKLIAQVEALERASISAMVGLDWPHTGCGPTAAQIKACN